MVRDFVKLQKKKVRFYHVAFIFNKSPKIGKLAASYIFLKNWVHWKLWKHKILCFLGHLFVCLSLGGV